MRIVLATHFFPPGHAGGTEVYTLGLARALVRRGHEPFVVCAENWGEGGAWKPTHRDDVHQGIPVRRLFWNWQLAPDPFVNLYDNPETERLFGEHVARVRPDVVHVTSCYSLGAGIIRAACRAGVPVILTLTDFWFVCPRHTLQRGDGSLCGGPTSAVDCSACLATNANVYRALSNVLPQPVVNRGMLAIGRWPRLGRVRGFRGYVGDSFARLDFLRRAFDEVSLAIAPSRFLLDTLVRCGYPAQKLRLSPYGIETDWLARLRPRTPDGRVRIGYIGQIEPLKGVDVLVRAFHAISAEVAAELRIHGGLEKNPRFASLLRSLAHDNPAVRFEGAFERGALADVLSELDVVVVPSIWYENAPVVVAEAFAAGKPVVASNLSGISEFVRHEVNGLLFERGDVPGLARALRRLIKEPALLERLRRGIGPARTIEQEVDELLGLYAAAGVRPGLNARHGSAAVA